MKKIISTILLQIVFGLFFSAPLFAYNCGETFSSSSSNADSQCSCVGINSAEFMDGTSGYGKYCCGWLVNDECYSTDPTADDASCGETYSIGAKDCACNGGGSATMANGTTTCCGWYDSESDSCKSSDVGISDIEVSANTLNSLNPLSNRGTDADLSTPGGIISRALGSFIFPIAGLILFVTLLLGGFQMLTGATSKGMEEGKQRITSAIIGFIILFAAYWIAQLLEMIFGIRILS